MLHEIKQVCKTKLAADLKLLAVANVSHILPRVSLLNFRGTSLGKHVH